MKFHPLRPVRDAFQGFFKHGLMSFASVTILAACMLIVGSVVMIILNLNTFVEQLQAQNEIVIFIDDKATDKDVEQIGHDLRAMSNVSEVQFVSKDEALEEYKSMFADQEDLFDTLDEKNPLRHSYHIKVADLEMFKETMDQIGKIENVSLVRSSSAVVEGLVNLRRTITIMGFWIVVILLFVSLFIISNTIRLGMYARRDEIKIMKYVGATNGYIRRPFIFEGIIIGIIAAGIAYGLQWYVYQKLIYPLLTQLSLFEVIPFESYWMHTLIAFGAFAILMGVIGSLLPMHKHLDA